MAVDGSLIFDTKIDTDGFEKGANSLSSKTIDLKNKISDTTKQIKTLKDELANMADTQIKSDVTVNLEKDVEKAKSKLNELYAQADNIGNGVQSSLSDMGFDNKYLDSMLEQNVEWQKIQAEITKAEATLNNYQKKLNSVNSAESKVTGKDTAEYSRKSQKVSELTGKLNVYKAKLNETQAKEQKTANQTAKSTTSYKGLSKTINKVGGSFNLFVKKLKSVAIHMKNAFSNTVSNTIKRIGSNTKRTNSELGILSKSLQRIKQALAGLLLYKILQGGIDGLKDGLNNLAKVSPKLNENLSALLSSLNYLKNSLASAFAPILNVVTPILTNFMDVLSNAANKVAQFIATLTGQTSYVQAVKVQEDYAKSIADTTKATDKNTKATEDNQKSLAGYDELNVVQQNIDNSSTDTDNTDEKEYYKTMPTVMSNYAEQLKNAFQKQDYSGIGQLVADKLNESLRKIKWSKISKTAKLWASNIAELINGFVKEADWNLIGRTIANGINTAFDFVERLIGKSGINFKKIGQAIAKGLTSLINKIDTKLLGEALADIINIFINFADGFSYDFDWANLGKQIKNTLTSFIKNIDFEGAKNAFVNTINGLVTTAINLIGTPDFFLWGQNVVNGIKSTLQGINWESISSLFSSLVIGALNFIDGMVISINWEQLGNDISASFTSFFSDGGDGYNIIKSIGQTFFDLFFGVLTLADTIANGTDWEAFGKNLASSFSVDIDDDSWTAQLSKTASDIVIALLDFINGVFEDKSSADKFSDGFSAMLDNVKWEEIFIKALSAVFNIASWILELAGSLIDTFCKGLATGFANMEDDGALNEAITGLGKSIGNLIITLVEQLLRILANSIPNFVIGLLKTIYQAMCGIVGFFLGDDWYNSVTSGIWGADSWHVDIPINIPRLATGTVVPAHYGEFLATLGDNKREPEIVSPLSTMKQALAEALAENGGAGSGDINITLMLDNEVLAKHTVKWNDGYKKTHGKSAFA